MSNYNDDFKDELDICLVPDSSLNEIDLNKIIFDIDSKISDLDSNLDTIDFMISASSGIVCSMLDIFWVGEFDLARGRDLASSSVDSLVKKVAKLTGCKKDDLPSCIKYLEDSFPVPSDGNMNELGGSLQHHLRDFSHHPTIVGLFFSLLTQFTELSYGTDTTGQFCCFAVPEKSRVYIGKDPVSKIINGIIIWFFHLISDIAGSHDSVLRNGGIGSGTGIPGPILSLAKELSSLPFFKSTVKDNNSFSLFISKLFNGTFLAKKDGKGKIIKDTVLQIDLRGELGIGLELGRQSIPVIANECFVRVLYFFRRLGSELKRKSISTFSKHNHIDWKSVKPYDSPTLSRMLLISTGVFTTVDIAEAVITKKYWVSINYVGITRFAVAIGNDIAWALKRYDLLKIKRMFEIIKHNTFTNEDNDSYERLGKEELDASKIGLTLEQIIVLYNMEYYKTLNDIKVSKFLANNNKIRKLKSEWINEWKQYVERGFSGFVQDENAVLRWYSLEELQSIITKLNPEKTWFKLAILETTLFTPYYPLSIEKDKNGKDFPSKKFNSINNPIFGFNQAAGDIYTEETFSCKFCYSGFVKRLRNCHSKVLKELNEVLKTTITSLAITAGIIILAITTAGFFAPQFAVFLVGSKFAGLSGAALTNACLAYLGGGAIAAGGAGIAGGTAAIVGGGALLGIGTGISAGGITKVIALGGKKATINQSAKLLVSVREVFLNSENDIDYSTAVYEQYVKSIITIEKDLVELKLKADTSPKDDKAILKKEIKNAEESVKAMKIAMKSMKQYINSYKNGLEEME